MEGFTLVDGIVAGVVLVSGILAYARGLVREIMAIMGWVAAAALAFFLAPSVEPLMREIPVVGGFLADSCELSVMAGFALVFALGLVLAALFTPLFSSAVRRSALGGVDMSLGFLFGVARGVLLVVVALIVYERAMAPGSMPTVESSRSAAVLGRLQGSIEEGVPDDVPNWIVRRYEDMVAGCTPPS
ncbi:CvpA family protein [Alkalilacustris brevis]|uniref:CvpA family protein n=1 Tax=Alkalilacustris brevis TaxID=2026338 RepID=UPI000E0DCC4B|nr:CvpA family protein [Alkalilacustris brevis]